MLNEFTAIIEAAPEGGYFAYCPEIPGANGQGDTVEQCRQNLAQAIELILDSSTTTKLLREERNGKTRASDQR